MKGRLHNVLAHAYEIEQSIKPNISKQVKRAIEERKQSKHSSNFHQRIDAKDLSQRRDRDSQAEKINVSIPVVLVANSSGFGPTRLW